MSLQRFKKGNSQQINALKSKLTILSDHIRRTQNLPPTLFMHPQLLGHLRRQKVYVQPTNQIFFKQSKSFIVSQRLSSKFYFYYLPIKQQKRYCLKVQPSKAQLQIFMQVDGSKKGSFFIKNNKAIIISQINWKKVDFIIQVKQHQKLSTVKICIDSIIVQHKVKIHGVPSQRKIVDQELKQYLKNNLNKQKINEILQKRKRKSMMVSSNSERVKTSSAYTSTKNLQTSRLFRNYSGFNESTSIVKTTSPVLRQPRIQSTQRKRDINYFQDSKQKFIKHIQKMSPQKANQLQFYKKKYNKNKTQTHQTITSLTIALIFMNRTYKKCVKILKSKMIQIHTRLLCKKFIKNLYHANKTRLTNRIRNKVTIDLNLSMISCCLWSITKKKAEQKILTRFQVQFFVIDVMKIANLSLKYIKSVKVLQKKYRINIAMYRFRFQVLTKKIKGFKFENNEQMEILFKKYKKYCLSKSKNLRFGFVKYHQKIDQFMIQLIQSRKPQKN